MFQKLVLFAILCSGFALAMDPTLAKGVSRVKFTYSSLDATSYFNYEQQPVPVLLQGHSAEFSIDRLELEYTYGWANDIAVIVRTAQDDRTLSSQGIESLKHDGFPGQYLGLRQRIRSPESTSIFSEIGVRTNSESDVPLALSGGGTDWFLLAGYSQAFQPSRAGFELDVGYIFAGGVADELVFDSKLHLDFLRFVMIDLEYHVLESQKDKKEIYTPIEWPKERGYQQGGIMLSADLTDSLSTSLGYQKRLRGRNQFETDGFQLSFSWYFGLPK